jgi:hypothetical protein
MRNNINKVGFFVILGVLVILGIPLLINLLLFQPWPTTPPDLSNKEWLGFWASFLGSIIGGVATFIAVYLSLKQNEKFHLDMINIQKNQTDFRRRELMPVLDLKPKDADFVIGKINNEGLCGLYISIEDHCKDPKFCYQTMQNSEYGFKSTETGIDINDLIFSFTNGDRRYIIFELTNIGLSFAFNVNVVLSKPMKTLQPIPFTNHIPKDGKEYLIINFKDANLVCDNTILITYYDSYNSRYVQRIDIITREEGKTGLIFNRYVPVTEQDYRTKQKMRTDDD